MADQNKDQNSNFGRRTWNREEFKVENNQGASQAEETTSRFSTQITLPMDLDKRIQRQYNLTSSKHKKQKILIHKNKVHRRSDADEGSGLTFQCYVCNYKFNNDLKLIEHWNTEQHIKKLTASEDIKYPVNYEKKCKGKKFVVKQHLKYLQDTWSKTSQE